MELPEVLKIALFEMSGDQSKKFYDQHVLGRHKPGKQKNTVGNFPNVRYKSVAELMKMGIA